MKHFSSLLLSLCIAFSGMAQSDGYTYLRTGAVQNSWYTVPCSIDTLLIEVKPIGLYAEVTVTMDFSTRGVTFSNSDSLEIQMMFQLPPDVEVTDMWLWVFGHPEQAGVYDRWTASQIYEDIVARRVDPAILYHYTWYDYYSNETVTNLYRFNIFPMLNDMPRKTKITYQVPLRAGNNGLYRIPLPMNIAQLSALPIEQFHLHVYPGDEFVSPTLSELPDQEFTNQGPFLSTDMTGYDGGSLNIRFQSARPDVYLGLYDTDEASSYFQFSARPKDLFDLQYGGSNTVVLFDHISQNPNDVTPSEMVNVFLTSFLPNLNESDSLNILFSGIVNQWVSDDWMVADEATRQWLTDELSEDDISGYSNLTMLLMDAVQFITESGADASIVLISNSNQFSNLTSSNDFIQNMTAVFNGTGIKVHVIDLDNVNNYQEYFWVNGQVFYGNRYAFNGLASLSGGEHLSIQNVAYSDMLDMIAGRLSPTLEAMDVHVTRSSGFTHSNHVVGQSIAHTYIDQQIGVTGVAVGTGDFIITCSAIEFDGTIHQNQTVVAPEMVYALDTVADNIWGGLKQRQLYGIDQSNSIVQTIIQNSKDFRVLSKYTAFLALEPSEGPLPITNDDPFDDGVIGVVEAINGSKSEFEVFPNPFSDVLTIDMALVQDMELTIVLYDLHGREVMQVFQGKVNGGRSMHTFDLSTVNPGMYVLRVSDRKGLPLTTLRAVKQ